MNLSREDAQAALNEIHQATAQTQHLLKAWLYSALVCGVVWTVVFAIAQWQPLSPVWSAGETMLVGIVCSYFFFWQRRMQVVRFTPGSHRAFIHSRLPLFYGILYVFFVLWQFVFNLTTMQVALFWITVVMLATITTGLLLQQRLFIAFGLGITLMTALGYWIVPTYFWLWIAAFAGLPLIGVSIYLLRKQ